VRRNYRRHLPHQIPEDTPIFLTWNLKGALPQEVLIRLQENRQRSRRGFSGIKNVSPKQGTIFPTAAFELVERHLDFAKSGPLDLKEPGAAQIVENAILFGAADRHELFAWCVMANHVHVLIKPVWTLPRITQGIKGFTAHEINILQSRRGRVFWQDESYDHWVRDEEELHRIIAYIENNPVAAGLCACPEDWFWSSARHRLNWPPGQPFRGLVADSRPRRFE
jgi:putative transposase